MIHVYLYLAATALFILGLKRLGSVKQARSGNQLAALGMLIAIVAALIEAGAISWPLLAAALVIGGGIGAYVARVIPMTSMPEMVAAFNGVGGAASALIAIAFVESEVERTGVLADALSADVAITVPLSMILGFATATGSAVAFLKLRGRSIRHPFSGALRHGFNALVALSTVGASVGLIMYASGPEQGGLAIAVVALLSGLLGVLLVLPIGGADMPVVVALLNAYSGLAAAASGFVVENLLLVVAGSLVGASGLILTQIMCKAMNRSLGNVLLGGMDEGGGGDESREYENITETSPEEVAMLLDAAGSVIIVPGYGLAVAQAQHAVRDLASALEERGTTVRYGIHPVAGRMPGHMNVLLAEADVPYDRLLDIDQVNGEFRTTDVVIVLGANDVVNPVAREKSGNPIAGMPILDVDYAQSVVVVKRSLSPGYAGIKNPLFENDNTSMVFRDAKEALLEMIKELKEL